MSWRTLGPKATTPSVPSFGPDPKTWPTCCPSCSGNSLHRQVEIDGDGNRLVCWLCGWSANLLAPILAVVYERGGKPKRGRPRKACG